MLSAVYAMYISFFFALCRSMYNVHISFIFFVAGAAIEFSKIA